VGDASEPGRRALLLPLDTQRAATAAEPPRADEGRRPRAAMHGGDPRRGFDPTTKALRGVSRDQDLDARGAVEDADVGAEKRNPKRRCRLAGCARESFNVPLGAGCGNTSDVDGPQPLHRGVGGHRLDLVLPRAIRRRPRESHALSPRNLPD